MNKYQEALNEIKQVSINIRAIPKHYCDVVCSQADILQELVDRATPKKPLWVEKQLTGEDLLPTWIDIPTCPNCSNQVYYPHCCIDNDCRQAIYWGGESEQIAKGETK